MQFDIGEKEPHDTSTRGVRDGSVSMSFNRDFGNLYAESVDIVLDWPDRIAGFGWALALEIRRRMKRRER